MKIALCQINPTVGDFAGNVARILDFTRRARDAGAHLAVFPELCITGYPPRDLLESAEFVTHNLQALDSLAAQVNDIAVIAGFVARNELTTGRRLYNAAAVITDGKVQSIHYKTLLPTYDVFDEDRYFVRAEKVELATLKTGATDSLFPTGKDVQLGVSICEDIWNDADYWPVRLYHDDPVAKSVALGAELLINISASPFSLGKKQIRLEMMQHLARVHRRGLVYVNQVGGNDQLVFDGNSLALDAEGNVIAHAKDFEEDIVIAEWPTGKGEIHSGSTSDVEAVTRALTMGLRDYVRKCGFKTVVLGLSGGIDSAVTAALAARALGAENVHGVALPGPYSSEGSLIDAEAVARNLGIHYQTISITPTFRAMLETLQPAFEGKKPNVAEENLQARIRGVILMALSNKHGHLVLTTGNKSEISVGYCTLYGDMCGGLAVISDCPKELVYDIARYINNEREIIPASSITKPPSAELRPNQKDEDSLPPYSVLDPILKAYVEQVKSVPEIVAMGHDEATVRRVARMVDANEYKRQQAAPGLRITSKAFGVGRRIPVARRIG